MPHRKLTQKNTPNQMTLRSKQNNAIELLTAVSEAEFICDSQFLELRINSEWLVQ